MNVSTVLCDRAHRTAIRQKLGVRALRKAGKTIAATHAKSACRHRVGDFPHESLGFTRRHSRDAAWVTRHDHVFAYIVDRRLEGSIIHALPSVADQHTRMQFAEPLLCAKYRCPVRFALSIPHRCASAIVEERSTSLSIWSPGRMCSSDALNPETTGDRDIGAATSFTSLMKRAGHWRHIFARTGTSGNMLGFRLRKLCKFSCRHRLQANCSQRTHHQ